MSLPPVSAYLIDRGIPAPVARMPGILARWLCSSKIAGRNAREERPGAGIPPAIGPDHRDLTIGVGLLRFPLSIELLEISDLLFHDLHAALPERWVLDVYPDPAQQFRR